MKNLFILFLALTYVCTASFLGKKFVSEDEFTQLLLLSGWSGLATELDQAQAAVDANDIESLHTMCCFWCSIDLNAQIFEYAINTKNMQSLLYLVNNTVISTNPSDLFDLANGDDEILEVLCNPLLSLSNLHDSYGQSDQWNALATTALKDGNTKLYKFALLMASDRNTMDKCIEWAFEHGSLDILRTLDMIIEPAKLPFYVPQELLENGNPVLIDFLYSVDRLWSKIVHITEDENFSINQLVLQSDFVDLARRAIEHQDHHLLQKVLPLGAVFNFGKDMVYYDEIYSGQDTLLMKAINNNDLESVKLLASMATPVVDEDLIYASGNKAACHILYDLGYLPSLEYQISRRTILNIRYLRADTQFRPAEIEIIQGAALHAVNNDEAKLFEFITPAIQNLGIYFEETLFLDAVKSGSPNLLNQVVVSNSVALPNPRDILALGKLDPKVFEYLCNELDYPLYFALKMNDYVKVCKFVLSGHELKPIHRNLIRAFYKNQLDVAEQQAKFRAFLQELINGQSELLCPDILNLILAEFLGKFTGPLQRSLASALNQDMLTAKNLNLTSMN